MEVFVARQPIFDRNQRVCAYELLYRYGPENSYNNPNGDRATSEVIANSFLVIGLETLTRGKRAFINFTENLLKEELATALPKDLIGVEIIENVEINSGVIEACQKLKGLGYLLALDDFVYNSKTSALVKMADVIKIDFISTPINERREIVKRLGDGKVVFLAEKVETREEFEQAMAWGYSLFQGHFFSKPTILSRKDIKGYKFTQIRVLQEISQPEPDFSVIENIIKRDVALSYKLLKYINSAAYGFRQRVQSIKHALVMLGLVEVKKWVSLIALREMCKDKPDEIMICSMIRGRFGELLAPKVGLGSDSSELFMVGLFSMIDALVDRPMGCVVADLPISDDVKNTLLMQESKYLPVFNLILAYERADWESFSTIARQLKLSEQEVPDLFVQSLEWANQVDRI